MTFAHTNRIHLFGEFPFFLQFLSEADESRGVSGEVGDVPEAGLRHLDGGHERGDEAG